MKTASYKQNIFQVMANAYYLAAEKHGRANEMYFFKKFANNPE